MIGLALNTFAPRYIPLFWESGCDSWESFESACFACSLFLQPVWYTACSWIKIINNHSAVIGKTKKWTWGYINSVILWPLEFDKPLYRCLKAARMVPKNKGINSIAVSGLYCEVIFLWILTMLIVFKAFPNCVSVFSYEM